MLKSMRRNNTVRNFIIFFIVVLLASYVLVSFGQAPPTVQGDTIVRLGSSKIKFRDALIAKRTMGNQFRQFNLTEEQVTNFTTNSIINEAVLMHGANELGIRVSDAELRHYVVDIRKNAAGEEGYLDSEQWSNYIKYNYSLQVEAFEEFLRDKELKVQKFRNLFAQSAYVSDQEVRDRFRLENEKIDMEILNANVAVVRNQLDLNDDNLKAYYDAHPDEFQSGDLRKVRFVEYDGAEMSADYEPTEEELAEQYESEQSSAWITQPSAAKVSQIQINGTDEAALDRARSVLNEINAGKEFTEAVTEHSEDASSNQRGGDMGFQPERNLSARFSPAAATAVFSAKPGSVVGPFQSRFGTHLLQVSEIRPETVRTLDEVRSQLVTKIKREKGTALARTAAADFLAKVRGGQTFDAAAEELSARIHTTPFFDSDNQSYLGEKLGTNFKAVQATFALQEIDEVSDLVELGQKFHVLQWIEESEPQLLDFENNKRRIRIAAQDKQGAAFIRNAFSEISAAIQADPAKSFADFIDQYDFLNETSIITPGPFNEDSVPLQLRTDEVDFAGLYALEVDELIGPLQTPQNLVVLARVLDKSAADESKFEDERTRLVEQIRTDRGNELLQSYAFNSRKGLDPNSQAFARVRASVEAVR